MPGMLYDNKAAAQLEEAYATTDMVAQREELRRSLRASPGESILDLGSGPGFLACELAHEVGATSAHNRPVPGRVDNTRTQARAGSMFYNLVWSFEPASCGSDHTGS